MIMNIKSFLAASLGGGVVSFIIGMVIWGFALDGLHQANITQYEGFAKENPNFALVAASCFAFCVILTLVFGRWANISTFKTGAIVGGIISVLVGLNHGLMSLAFQNLYNWVVVGSDILGNLAWGGITGGVIALILGKVKD